MAYPRRISGYGIEVQYHIHPRSFHPGYERRSVSPTRLMFDTIDSDEKNGFLTFMSLQICFLEELITSNFLVNASDNADLILGQEFLKKVKAVTDQNPKKIIPQTWTPFLRKGTALKLYASLGLKQYEMIRTRATGKETKGPESGWTPCVTQ